MKREFKISFSKIIIVLLIVISGYYGITLYHGLKPVSIDDTDKAEFVLNSHTLLTSFKTNNEEAKSALIEKVIEVEGIIYDIIYKNDRYTVILKGEDKFSQILCDMSDSEIEKVKNLHINQPISIKGICKGYLMDVIMLNCILVTK